VEPPGQAPDAVEDGATFLTDLGAGGADAVPDQIPRRARRRDLDPYVLFHNPLVDSTVVMVRERGIDVLTLLQKGELAGLEAGDSYGVRGDAARVLGGAAPAGRVEKV
jgi:hypothetical protein